MSDDRNQRAAVRLIKGAATRADLTRTCETRTCETCASSAPTNPKPRCYVCAGPTTAQSQWAPIKNPATI